MTLKNMAKKIPEAMVILNGGYFHYDSFGTYEWEGERKLGAPVGEVKVDGKTVSSGPFNPLWGRVAVFGDRAVTVGSSSSESEEQAAPTHALGCAPMLIQQNQPIALRSYRPSEDVKGAFPAPGEFERHIHERHPRTAVAETEDALLFITVDGRDRGRADGMTGDQLAELAHSLGAVSALNLDGGGSTAMLVRKSKGGKAKVVNQPSDYYPRPLGSALAIVDLTAAA
jgi:exopolysaccharide biosynthesis protein